MGPYRIVFAGTPDFAAAHLAALLQHSHNVVAAYTQPDRRGGRGKKLLPSPVKLLARQHDIPVHQPTSLKPAEQSEFLRSLEPDLLIVVAYGLILPRAILDVPKIACINVHASLLPRWRGAAPVERALLAGDQETGVTIMLMDEGLDTGDMLHKARCTIADSDNRETLLDKLTQCGQQALLHSLANLDALIAGAEKQDDQASTYAAKLEKSEALIDWGKSADEIHRQIRAGIGRAPAYSVLDGLRIRILDATPIAMRAEDPGTIVDGPPDRFRVACQDSVLEVDRVQLPGKTAMSVSEVRNSRRDLFAPGQHFSQAGDSE